MTPAPTDLDVLVPCCGRPASLAAVLAGLTAQSVQGWRLLLSDQSDGEPAYDDPAVRGVLRVLQHRGTTVETGRHLPRRGIAEHRQHLLERSSASRVLYLDDDVLLDPSALATMLDALGRTGAGFVGLAMQGLSYLGDERPHEQVAYEEWDGPVQPEVVRKDTPGWERWRLHNAANLVHLSRDLDRRRGPAPRGWRAYKVAWLAGCVLFDRAALVEAGGFSFWRQLPPESAGEDVVAQLRVMERRGGAGLLPPQAWHLELPTTLADRRVDAYAEVIGNP